MNLKFKNYPTKDGEYYAANHNTVHNRLEIELVKVLGNECFVEGDYEPFRLTDFDFWGATKAEE